MTTNTPKLISKFRISDNDLSDNETTSRAFSDYADKREKFCDAKNELAAAMEQLRNVLDGPLRLQGLVPEGRDWTFREDDDGDLVVFVWSETKQKGRKKKEVPFQSLNMKKMKAA